MSIVLGVVNILLLIPIILVGNVLTLISNPLYITKDKFNELSA